MMHLVVIAVCGVLSLIFFQDLKSRTVHVALFAVYMTLLIPYYIFTKRFIFPDFFFNIGYIIVLVGITALAVARWKSTSIKDVFGAGDVVFLLISAFYFDFPGFVIWLNVALIVCLVLHFTATSFSPEYRRKNLVPLAGFLAAILIPAIILEVYVRPVSSFIH